MLCSAAMLSVARAAAADISEVKHELLTGEYEQVIANAAVGAKAERSNPEWTLVWVQGLLALGRNTDAERVIEAALDRDSRDIRMRWLARDVAFANGRPEDAAGRLEEIRRLVSLRPWNYRTPPDMVAVGRAALLLDADPKQVLDKLYATAQAADPKLRECYLARGELALEKHDFALAAKAFDEGLKQVPDDPDLLCGRARAYAETSHETAVAALAAALKVNPRHIPSLLQLADHHIDAEAYADADHDLDRVIAINPGQPDAWAYRAVLAHLRNDADAERAHRQHALETWSSNPRVDFLIGQKLAQKYRFAEAAAYQRRALELDSTYLPASAELATDLLRVGDEANGWNVAQAVHTRDEYDVEAYNLVTLHDTMAKYATLNGRDFVIRMAAPEVTVYGPRVLDLLRKAKQTLTAKYGVELESPTYVEIFADEKDFAVRTFGLPDIPGFLGVCFGRVVTANSPATRSPPVNWQSVLWHEFCHAVTLQLTKNKMPRWLSEGISVYEERQAEPSWGMRLNPHYREMLLGDDLVPIGKLSGAFLAPKSSLHLQFAYLESSLAVEFLVQRFGFDHLRSVLLDLRNGTEINAALAKNTEPLPELEKEFVKYAQERAEQLGPKLNWEKPDPDLLLSAAADQLAIWERNHPDNFALLHLRATHLMEDEKWAEACVPLSRLVELYPEQKGADCAYRPLVAALRARQDTAAERSVLVQWAAVDDEAPDAYLRLMELAAAEKDWPTVKLNGERYLRVNPLIAAPYRYLAEAAMASGDVAGAALAWRTLLQLDPADPAEAHYQLAQLLHARGENLEAKRQVLCALEETPRFRAALQLLTEIEHASAPMLPPPAVGTGAAP
jgi:tetratricopeptide (TPR) repeat protein